MDWTWQQPRTNNGTDVAMKAVEAGAAGASGSTPDLLQHPQPDPQIKVTIVGNNEV